MSHQRRWAQGCRGTAAGDVAASGRRRKTTKIVLSPQNGHGGRVRSLVISATYAANSLLGGSMEFFRRSTNFARTYNPITVEFVQVGETGKCGHLSALDTLPERRPRGQSGVAVPARV